MKNGKGNLQLMKIVRLLTMCIICAGIGACASLRNPAISKTNIPQDSGYSDSILTNDNNPPLVTIFNYTLTCAVDCDYADLRINGTADDDTKITNVHWSGNNNKSGDCNGTTEWSTSRVQLTSAENLVTVTAKDAAGNVGSDSISINCPCEVNPQAALTYISGIPGQPIIVTVIYNNSEENGIFKTTISAPLPPELNYVEGSADPSGGEYHFETHSVDWTIDHIAANQTITREFKARLR